MIAAIACDIKEIVLSSGYVNTHFEYCELIRKGDLVYPAQYTQGGNYEEVFNNDVGGNSYLRKNGKTTFSSPPKQRRIKACSGDDFVKMSIPLRLVMVVPKTKLQDNAFSDELLVQEMISLISGDQYLPEALASELEYVITDYDTDSLSIWSQEVKGMEYQMLFDYSYIAINFSAQAIINPACLYQTCGYGSESGQSTIYYGNSLDGALINTEIDGLNQRNSTTFVGTYPFGATVPSEYKYIAYPASWGDPARFVDPSTNFDVAMNIKYTVSINSVTYNVYRTFNKLGGAIDIELQ